MKSFRINVALIAALFFVVHEAQAQQSFLRPDFLALQHAGSIGYLSAGLGYDVYQSRARLSFHYGNVPENLGGDLDIFTGKFLCVPAVIRASEQVIIHPIDVGVMVSYHTGDNFKSNVPDYFSKNYYWWHTNLRFHVAIEQSVNIYFHERRIHRISGYIEFNLNDLYVVSYVTNSSTVGLDELVKAGIGTRIWF